MYYYIIPFLVYVISIPLIANNYLLVARVAILLSILFLFKKFYKFKLKFDTISVLIGFVIFLSWILLEGFYPILGTTSYAPESNTFLLVRIFSFVIITPIIEEFFTRNFLARILVKNDWEKVPIGKFTATSFILTALFFGFSHNRWLPGLIAGALLNYLIYKKKNMNSIILAHSTANILLAIYIIYTKSWVFW